LSELETDASTPRFEIVKPAAALSACPQCDAGLAVLRIIQGRSGCEYWTLRCPRCGGIHLEIVNSPSGDRAK
jgi:hypothetical protein